MCKVLYTIMGVCGERRVGHVFFLRSGGGGTVAGLCLYFLKILLKSKHSMLQKREEHSLDKHHKYFCAAELHTETLTFLVFPFFFPVFPYIQEFFFPFCSSYNFHSFYTSLSLKVGINFYFRCFMYLQRLTTLQ